MRRFEDTGGSWHDNKWPGAVSSSSSRPVSAAAAAAAAAAEVGPTPKKTLLRKGYQQDPNSYGHLTREELEVGLRLARSKIKTLTSESTELRAEVHRLETETTRLNRRLEKYEHHHHVPTSLVTAGMSSFLSSPSGPATTTLGEGRQEEEKSFTARQLKKQIMILRATVAGQEESLENLRKSLKGSTFSEQGYEKEEYYMETVRLKQVVKELNERLKTAHQQQQPHRRPWSSGMRGEEPRGTDVSSGGRNLASYNGRASSSTTTAKSVSKNTVRPATAQPLMLGGSSGPSLSSLSLQSAGGLGIDNEGRRRPQSATDGAIPSSAFPSPASPSAAGQPRRLTRSFSAGVARHRPGGARTSVAKPLGSDYGDIGGGATDRGGSRNQVKFADDGHSNRSSRQVKSEKGSPDGPISFYEFPMSGVVAMLSSDDPPAKTRVPDRPTVMEYVQVFVTKVIAANMKNVSPHKGNMMTKFSFSFEGHWLFENVFTWPPNARHVFLLGRTTVPSPAREQDSAGSNGQQEQGKKKVFAFEQRESDELKWRCSFFELQMGLLRVQAQDMNLAPWDEDGNKVDTVIGDGETGVIPLPESLASAMRAGAEMPWELDLEVPVVDQNKSQICLVTMTLEVSPLPADDPEVQILMRQAKSRRRLPSFRGSVSSSLSADDAEDALDASGKSQVGAAVSADGRAEPPSRTASISPLGSLPAREEPARVVSGEVGRIGERRARAGSRAVGPEAADVLTAIPLLVTYGGDAGSDLLEGAAAEEEAIASSMTSDRVRDAEGEEREQLEAEVAAAAPAPAPAPAIAAAEEDGIADDEDEEAVEDTDADAMDNVMGTTGTLGSRDSDTVRVEGYAGDFIPSPTKPSVRRSSTDSSEYRDDPFEDM